MSGRRRLLFLLFFLKRVSTPEEARATAYQVIRTDVNIFWFFPLDAMCAV